MLYILACERFLPFALAIKSIKYLSAYYSFYFNFQLSNIENTIKWTRITSFVDIFFELNPYCRSAHLKNYITATLLLSDKNTENEPAFDLRDLLLKLPLICNQPVCLGISVAPFANHYIVHHGDQSPQWHHSVVGLVNSALVFKMPAFKYNM